VAGQSLERLAALSDGIFAVALTLLVLDLHVPVSSAINSEGDLWNALLKLVPSFSTYFMSFLTLGIFWVGQQTQLNHFVKSTRTLSWLHLIFLLTVGIMPFSTAFLASFITFRLALVFYWFNILLMGIPLFFSWRYASSHALLRDDITEEVLAAMERRIIVAQSLYALATVVCIFNTYLSIGLLVLLQLVYAIAPRVRFLDRL
jgi:uncharacterized membrane protein